MSKVKEMVDKTAKSLTENLANVQQNMRQIEQLQEYMQLAEEIELTELEKLLDLCEGYLGDINVLFKEVEYLTYPRIEGKLVLDTAGMYRLDTDDILLKDGYTIEVLVEDPVKKAPVWRIGRLLHDHAHKEYYFVSSNKRYNLEAGAYAAVRLEGLEKTCTS